MQIAIIGLGEAGSAFISGWGASLADRITAYDIKSADPATVAEITDRARALGIRSSASAAEALSGATLILSTVTADQSVAVARTAAPLIANGACFCDLNSCAPSSKRSSAKVIAAAGGRYVDVAVMAPVHPALNMAPCLASGPHAADIAPVLQGLPMSVRVVGDEVGHASSIKMIRSVMVKGMEALTAECTLAAVAAGVEDEVLPSMVNGAPNIDVATRAAYNFERSLCHGARRAAEMEEVAITLADLGLPNGMAAATAAWQGRIAATGIPAPAEDEIDDYRPMARAILAAIRET